MLSNLFVANFRSIGSEGLAIQPRPLTVLTGPNGAGKSSVLEALCLLSQSLGQGELRFGAGEYVKYNSPKGFVYKGDLSRLLQISLTVETQDSSKSGPRSPGILYAYRYDPLEVIQKALSAGREVASESWVGKTGELVYTSERGGFHGNARIDPRTILHPDLFDPSSGNAPEYSQSLVKAMQIVSAVSAFLKEKFYFISAFRGASKFYLDAQSGQNARWVGTDGAMTNHILSMMFGSRSYNEQAERVAEWAEKFSLGGLKAGWAGGGLLKSDYVDPVLQTVLETAFASHGSRQALSFITQIFWSKPGSTLVIEEPEISLHPESQTLLPALFAEATRRGVQVIITTHSPFLILALWKPVSEKAISASDIAVYHFEKGEEGSRAKSLELSPDGHLKEWVPSFSAAETKLLKEFIDKVPAA